MNAQHATSYSLHCALLFTVLWGTRSIGAPESEYPHFIRQGDREASRRMYNEALEWYQKAAAIDDTDAELHYSIGMTYIRLNRVLEAKQHFEKAIERNPNHSRAHALLGRAYQYHDDDLERAEKHLKRAIAINSRNLQAYNHLGEVYLSQDRVDEAESMYTTMVEIDPNRASGHLGLGKVFQKRREYEKAAESFQQAIRKKPSDDQPFLHLAQVLMRLGKRGESRKALERYRELNEKREEIIRLRNAIRSKPDDPALLLRIAKAHMDRSEYKEAVAYLEGCLRIDPLSDQAHSIAGALYLRLHQVDRALPHIQKVLELQPDAAMDWNNLGVCHQLKGELQKAAEAFGKAVSLEPENRNFKKNLETVRSRLESTGNRR